MKHVLLGIIIIYGAFATAHAQFTDTLQLTLSEALAQALDENQDIRLARLEQARAESQLKQARGSFYPQLNIDARYTRNIKRPVFFIPAGSGFPGGEEEGSVIEAGFDNGYQATAQASLPLFNKALYAQSKAANTSVALSEQALAVSRNEVIAQVKKAYYDALLARESLNVMEQSLQNARRNLENVRNLFNQDLSPEYDVIRAEVQVENLKPDVRRAENDYDAAIANLKLLTNISPQQPIALTQSLEGFYQALEQEALEAYSVADNPNLRQLGLQQQLQEYQVDVQQATFFPTLSAFGNYAYQSQANNFDFNDYRWVETSAVGLQLNIPLFEGLSRVQQVEQARIDLEQTRLQQSYLRRSLNIQAENALDQIYRAQLNIETQQKNIRQAEKGYQIAQVSYKSGVGTLIEVNDAELALTQARLNYVQAIHEYVSALADFKQIVGQEFIEE